MTDLVVLPLGVGDAFSAERYSTCFALGAGPVDAREWILVDCPHPIRKMLREGGRRAGVELDLDRVRAVVLTHLHADHASGLEGYGYFSFFALGRRARVLTHPAVARRLWDGHLAAGMERLIVDGAPHRQSLDDYFEVETFTPAEPLRLGPFEISSRLTHHHLPTIALRVRVGEHLLGISSDTAYDEGLIGWLEPAGLILHETNLGPAHTPYDRLAALPAELRAKMRLYHYPDGFPEAFSPSHPPAIALLEEGELISIERASEL